MKLLIATDGVRLAITLGYQRDITHGLALNVLLLFERSSRTSEKGVIVNHIQPGSLETWVLNLLCGLGLKSTSTFSKFPFFFHLQSETLTTCQCSEQLASQISWSPKLQPVFMCCAFESCIDSRAQNQPRVEAKMLCSKYSGQPTHTPGHTPEQPEARNAFLTGLQYMDF